MKGKARTRPDILRVVLGPYMQYCPCEASEQKPESELKAIELSYCHHSIRLKKQAFRRKECQNWTKNDQVMPNLMFLCQSGESGIWPILCQLMAILAKLLEMDFKFVFSSIYFNFDIQTNFEVNQTEIGHYIPNTPKTHQSGHISKPHFALVSFTKKPTPPKFFNEFF